MRCSKTVVGNEAYIFKNSTLLHGLLKRVYFYSTYSVPNNLFESGANCPIDQVVQGTVLYQNNLSVNCDML